jgi:predicted PurR-regulated permease PerM
MAAAIVEPPPPPAQSTTRAASAALAPGTNNLADLRKLLFVATAAILVGLFPFASGLIGSLMLCTLLRSAHQRLLRLVGPRASALILAVGALVTLLLPGAWLLSTIVREARGALATLDINQAAAWLSSTRFGSTDLSREVANVASGLVSWLSGHAVTVVGTVTSALLNVLIALFGLYYLLLGGDALWTRARRFLPVNEATADALASRFVDVTDALLLGTLLTAVLQGTVVGGAFAIVGLNPPILWGFVTACASVLPVLGSALVWLPGVIVLLVQHRPGAAVFLLVVGAGVASNLDNLARPFVYRRVSGIHPMLTLVGAFAGVRLFGLIGAFIGPLVLSYFLELLDVYDEAKRQPAS